jgi:hypothetical protein
MAVARPRLPRRTKSATIAQSECPVTDSIQRISFAGPVTTQLELFFFNLINLVFFRNVFAVNYDV